MKLLLQCAEIRRRVLRDDTLPEHLRRKVAVFSIETIFIADALKRRNRRLKSQGRWLFDDCKRHGLVTFHDFDYLEDEFVQSAEFFWFGNPVGLCLHNVDQDDTSVHWSLDSGNGIYSNNGPYPYFILIKEGMEHHIAYSRSRYVQEAKKVLEYQSPDWLAAMASRLVIESAFQMEIDPEVFE